MNIRTLLAGAAVMVALGGLAACGQQSAANVDGARILAADKEPGNWMSHGRTYSEQRFSPLDAVNTSNVKDLGLAWSFELALEGGSIPALSEDDRRVGFNGTKVEALTTAVLGIHARLDSANVGPAKDGQP